MVADLTPWSDVAATYDLGPIDQIAFVVEDMEAALPLYRVIFGEFARFEASFSPDVVSYRGEPVSATLAVAIGHSGDLEIELIELIDGQAPFAEHLRRHGQGLHHIRFSVSNMAEKVAKMVDAGFDVVLEGHRPNGRHFAYLEAPAGYGHTLFELIQFAPGDLQQRPGERHGSQPVTHRGS